MIDHAHAQTNGLLAGLESRLRRLHRRTNKRIQRDITPLLGDIALDKENATQTQRLRYAERNGKGEVVEAIADALTEANRQTVSAINAMAVEYYRLNVKAASAEIIAQIKDSMDR